jgi:hypothetical protein
MQISAAKLSQFLPFSPIYPDILKKAEGFAKTAKNQAVVRSFMRSIRSSRGPCFIADAAFAEQPHAPELHLLRRFRDEKLRASKTGRRLIALYYRCSPPLARVIARSQRKSFLARWMLTKITGQLKKTLNSN